MNKQTEALKLALECIEAWDRGGNASDYWRDRFDAITAIREALAEQDDPDLQDKDPELVEQHYKQVVDGVREMFDAKRKQPAQQEQLREENERLHVENRRLIDRIETIGVPVGVGGFATTTTAQRTWVGLTDETIIKIGNNCRLKAKPTSTGIIIHPDGMKEFGRAVEAKLREKNT